MMFYRNFKFSGPYSTGRVLSERYNKVLRTLQERKTCVIQVKIQIDWLNMNSKPIAKRAWELVPLKGVGGPWKIHGTEGRFPW